MGLIICPRCNGDGRVPEIWEWHPEIDGVITVPSRCPRCSGTGKISFDKPKN